MPTLSRALLTLAATVALLLGAAAAQTYRDVPPHHWALPAIERLAETGIMIGDHEGHFNGTDALSRYELAVMLDRLMRHQDAALAAATEDALDTAHALEELERLNGRVDDLFVLFEQILSTQNVDLSNVHARLDDLESVTAALRALQAREPEPGPAGPAGPPGPQGPAGSSPDLTRVIERIASLEARAAALTDAIASDSGIDEFLERLDLLEADTETLTQTVAESVAEHVDSASGIDELLERLDTLERRIDDLAAAPPAPAPITITPAAPAPATPTTAASATPTTTPEPTTAAPEPTAPAPTAPAPTTTAPATPAPTAPPPANDTSNNNDLGYWTSWGDNVTAPHEDPADPLSQPLTDPLDNPATHDTSSATRTLEEWCASRPNNPICE